MFCLYLFMRFFDHNKIEYNQTYLCCKVLNQKIYRLIISMYCESVDNTCL